VVDPWANPNDVKKEYDISTLTEMPNHKYDAIILAVGHLEFLRINLQEYLNSNSVIFDVKGILDKQLTDGRL
jgi:UDP-N-acetyl-D-galactosamine dehydrogenase